MSEQEAVEKTFETPSFGDALKSVQSKVSTETQTETVAEPAKVDTAATEAEQPKPEPVAEPAAAKADPAPQSAQAPTAPGLGFVPVAAVQAERAKRQELEARLKELETQSYIPAESAPPAQQDTIALERNIRRDLSEQMARKQYSDYDEKVALFASEVYDTQTGQLKNPALWESVESSPLPAEAAYRAGIQISEAKKLGGWDVISDPVKYRAALEKQIRGDIEKEIRSKVEAEIAGKALSKSKTITDISQARAASGASETEFEIPSFGQALRNVQRKR